MLFGQRDRLQWPPARMAGVMLVGGAIGYALLASNRTPLIVPVWFLSFAFGWGVSGLVFLLASRVDPAQTASSAGHVLKGGATGGMVGPALFGVVAQSSYPMAWSLIGAATLVAAGLLLRTPADMSPHKFDSNLVA